MLQQKKNTLNSKLATGADLADVKAAKRNFKEYDFLAWLEENFQQCETGTSLRCFRLEGLESGSTDHLDSDNTKSVDIEADLNRASKKKKKKRKKKTTAICTKVSDNKAN